jgi:hypothetical protein
MAKGTFVSMPVYTPKNLTLVSAVAHPSTLGEENPCRIGGLSSRAE